MLFIKEKKMDAIVYTSYAGHTKQYADLLSKKTGLSAYTIEEAKSHLSKSAEVIYLGWVRKGKVEGFHKAEKLFHIACIGAVGMGIEDGAVSKGIAEQSGVKGIPLYYMQGGFDYNRLSGMNKFIMKQFKKTLIPAYESQSDLDEAQMNMLKMFRDGGNSVSIDRLAPILNWYREKAKES
jgi:hypothetical protein